MGVNGRGKGTKNELVLAKAFQAWWGWGSWARTPMSGGWATPAHRDGFRTHGDIITTSLDFPFTVEAKKQEKWDLDALLHNDGCLVHKWWDQAIEGTPDHLLPLLVCARNRVPQVVMFDLMPMRRLIERLRAADPAVEALHAKEPIEFWQLNRHYILDQGVDGTVAGRPTLVIMPLESLFKHSPDLFGRKLPMPDEKKPDQRPNVPEPKIPTCDRCNQPLTRCACDHNKLQK